MCEHSVKTQAQWTFICFFISCFHPHPFTIVFLLTGDLVVGSSKKKISKRSYKSKKFTVVYVCEG